MLNKKAEIEALCSFGGHDAGRDGKLVIMSKGDVQEVSKDFAKEVIQAGHAKAVASSSKKSSKEI